MGRPTPDLMPPAHKAAEQRFGHRIPDAAITSGPVADVPDDPVALFWLPQV